MKGYLSKEGWNGEVKGMEFLMHCFLSVGYCRHQHTWVYALVLIEIILLKTPSDLEGEKLTVPVT